MKYVLIAAAFCALPFTSTWADEVEEDCREESVELISAYPSDEAKQAIEEIRTVLNQLIQELNGYYKVEMTLSDACEIVKKNVDHLGLAPEGKQIFLIGLEIIQTGDEGKLPELERLLDGLDDDEDFE